MSRNKPAYQSSITHYTNNNIETPNGVDGDISTWFHTDNEASPKWWVDLQEQFAIDVVVVINRIQCCRKFDKITLGFVQYSIVRLKIVNALKRWNCNIFFLNVTS